MVLVKKEDHVDEGIANLIEQFKNKDNLRKFLTSFLEQIQDLEDAFDQILTLTDVVAVAFGQQLDNLGLIVGEERFGRSDEQYRIAIDTRILLNNSSGTPENIIALIRALESSLSVEVRESFPASFIADVVTPIDPLLVDLNQIADVVKSGRPAGVEGFVEFRVAGAKQFDTAGAGFDLGKFSVVLETC